MDKPAVFIVEADQAMCHVLETTLAAWGMRTKSKTNPRGVIDEVKENFYNLVLLDLGMPSLNGLDVLTRLEKHSPRTKVIAMVNDTEQEKALAALKRGAFDWFEKSSAIDFLSHIIHQALHMQHLEEEHQKIGAELRRTHEECQTYVEQLEASRQELREVNQAVLVVAKNIENARKEGEERILERSRGLLQPFIKRLMQHGETLPYGVQLDRLLAEIEASNIHVTTSFAANAMLSTREVRVALMIKEGMKNEEIATRLYISPETVKTHRKNIRKKLGLRGSKKNLQAYLHDLGRFQAS